MGVMSFKAPGKNQIYIRLQGKAAHAGVETNCHTKEEYIEEKDLYDAARWALQIVKDAGQMK